MNGARLAKLAVTVMLVVGAAWYLYDPPWVGGLTSGIRDWEEDPPGTRFRWTAGRANFYVPSDAMEMTLPVRALLPSPDGGPVTVRVTVDDRFVTTIVLSDIRQWAVVTLPLPRQTSRRRYRRVELYVSRTVGEFNLGVQLGEIRLRP